MATALQIITTAMKDMGAIAVGETASSDEASDGLVKLNNVYEGLGINKLAIYERVREKFTLTPSTQSYTMGTGGNFNTARPTFIESATIEDQLSSDLTEWPLVILRTNEEWAQEPFKNRSTAIPTKIFLAGTFPLETIYFLEIPSAANKIVLYSLKPLTAIASTATSLSLPPGYSEYIGLELIYIWAGQFGKSITPAQDQRRRDLKSDIKRQNLGGALLNAASLIPAGRGGLFDIMTGDYR